MRYTKLSFEQIVKELNNSDDPHFSKSFLLREMGNLLLEGGEDAKQAEEFFLGLLDSNDPECKLSAYRHLCALERMNNETYIKLVKFQGNFANKGILQEAALSAV